MKFYEYILNSSKVIERTRFCHGTANYKLQRDVSQKIHIQELWFLHSACHLLVLNICMKFYEYILNSSKVIERTRFCHGTANYKLQRDVSQKIHIQESWFLHFACLPLVLNICMKFYEYILNISKVIERTRFLSRNCYLKSSKGCNSKNINTRVMVLALCTSPNVG